MATFYTGIIPRVLALTKAGDIAPGIEMGFHLCYGDAGHKHFAEPGDTGLMVKVAKDVIKGVGRKVDWIHMPVPKERDDEAYFAPLRDLIPSLKEHGTQLYLGLVRERDEQGTKSRAETAAKLLQDDNIEWGGRQEKTSTTSSKPLAEWRILSGRMNILKKNLNKRKGGKGGGKGKDKTSGEINSKRYHT